MTATTPRRECESADEYGALTLALGTKTKLQITEYLVRNGPSRQVEIADGIGVTQAAVSRSKRALLDSNLIQADSSTLSIAQDIESDLETIIATVEST